MTTFIKTKLKKSNDQTNIDKYRVAANITEYGCSAESLLARSDSATIWSDSAPYPTSTE